MRRHSTYFNDAPMTHTICYTIDGLLETGELLGDAGSCERDERARMRFCAAFRFRPRLPGRLDAIVAPGVN